jgi:hypothetical protein
MTGDEVQMLLGEPQRASAWFIVNPTGERLRCSCWSGARHDLTVYFCPNETVTYVQRTLNPEVHPTVVDRLWEWLTGR